MKHWLVQTANLDVLTVVARFRPQNKVELSSGGTPIVEFEGEESCRVNVRANTDNLLEKGTC